MAVDQLTKDEEDIRVLVRNVKEQERRASPTSRATILLTPTQKVMQGMLEIGNASDPTGPLPCVQLTSLAYL